jgi:hypothetical protein
MVSQYWEMEDTNNLLMGLTSYLDVAVEAY